VLAVLLQSTDNRVEAFHELLSLSGVKIDAHAILHCEEFRRQRQRLSQVGTMVLVAVCWGEVLYYRFIVVPIELAHILRHGAAIRIPDEILAIVGNKLLIVLAHDLPGFRREGFTVSIDNMRSFERKFLVDALKSVVGHGAKGPAAPLTNTIAIPGH
jgi:hypothetical protein